MTHEEKVQHFAAELARLGKSPRMAAPPLWRFIWWLGWKVPPPPFLGFWPITLAVAPLMAILWGLGMWVIQWQSLNLNWVVVVVASAAFGILTAPFVGLAIWNERRKLRLPPWKDYPEV